MPLLTITTSASLPSVVEQGALLTRLSAQLGKLLGKPEAYVLTSWVQASVMTFAGTTAPACYVEVKSIGGIDAASAARLSAALCESLSVALALPAQRIYLEFSDVPGALWGHDGETFDGVV
jgi:phenylpyruvate tautomerase